MAQAIIKGIGGGGITSDDVTASRNQVLAGYTTITNDSNDEVVNGAIKTINTQNNNYRVNKSEGFGIDNWSDTSNPTFYIDFPHGNAFYHRADNHPHVCIDAVKLGDAVQIDVVDTKTFTSKNGVNLRGTLPNRGNGGKPNNIICGEMWYYQQEDCYVTKFPQGAYYNAGEQGQWSPYVSVPVALAKTATNYHPEKTLNDTVTCNERGHIKMVNTQDNNYDINKSSAFGLNVHSGRFWIDFPHGNAFYYRNDNHPHVQIDAAGLGTAGADSVLQWQTATSQHGVNFQGSIPRWICNTGDVISAVNNSGFAWDDTTGANRGRGVVSKIPNGHYIQGANYVFLPSPNLYPQNIRAGVNILGITGTMPDYSSGRVVFNSATFDGLLVSGVANKPFFTHDDFSALYIAENYKFSGIWGGGINLSLATDNPPNRNRWIGFVFSQSINFTPFSRIAINYDVAGNVQNNPNVNFECFVTPVKTLQRNASIVSGVGNVDRFITVYQTGSADVVAHRQGQIIIDTRYVNEQVFIGFRAKAQISSNRDVFNGHIQVTRVEFFN